MLQNLQDFVGIGAVQVSLFVNNESLTANVVAAVSDERDTLRVDLPDEMRSAIRSGASFRIDLHINRHLKRTVASVSLGQDRITTPPLTLTRLGSPSP